MRGFEKVYLQAGESKDIYFSIRTKDISTWHTASKSWKVPSGKIWAHIGENSRDLEAKACLQ